MATNDFTTTQQAEQSFNIPSTPFHKLPACCENDTMVFHTEVSAVCYCIRCGVRFEVHHDEDFPDWIVANPDGDNSPTMTFEFYGAWQIVKDLNNGWEQAE